MAHYQYLVIGGGMTADSATQGIRELDKDGSIGMISGESEPPYDRPPLSKGLWKGQDAAAIVRSTASRGVTTHLGRKVIQLDLATQRAVDDQAAEYTFDRLLLATGGRPRQLKSAADGVIYFRTLDDYRRLRSLTEHGADFVVVGGGFIGSEIAAGLAMNGKRVTMIFPNEAIGGRVFPPELGAYVNDYYRQKGVTVLAGETVVAVEKRGNGYAARTHSGQEYAADGVVAGLGIEPNVELAASAGLAVENGIVVDEFLSTGQAGVFAAGDVASFHNPALGKRMRVEHEDNANSMGKQAGRNMAGAHEPYTHLPFFYSDLFELGYEAVGDLDARLETVTDWKDPFKEGVIYYLDGGRVRGVLLWNVWGQVDAARELIAQPGPFAAAALKGRLPK